MTPSQEPRIVKRYANRKLYDTRRSRYVTLEQVAAMIRGGDDVKVIDNKTGDDLTSVTLAQIIFEEEKRAQSFLPLALLRRMVQSGGASLDHLRTQLVESPVGRVFRREGAAEPDAAVEGGAAGQAGAGMPAPRGPERSDPARRLRDLLEGAQQALDQWQRRIESGIQSAVGSVSPLAPLHRELKEMRERMDRLEHQLRAIAGDVPPEDGGGRADG